jgi:hypothetical protein
MWFFNAATGLIAGENGLLKKTTDSGKTWTDLRFNSNYYDDLYKIKFIDDKTGYITAESGNIYKTIDGGNTWKKHSSPIRYGFPVIEYGTDSTVYIAGTYGSILRSSVVEFRIDSSQVFNVTNCKVSFSTVVTSMLTTADSIWFQYGIGNFDQQVITNPSSINNERKKLTITLENLLPSTNYKWRVKVLHNGQYVYSETLNATTAGKPQAPTIFVTGDSTICAGDSVTLTSAVDNGLQWHRNGAILPGATSRTLIAKQSGRYQLVRTFGCFTSDTSSVLVTVNPAPLQPTITAASGTLTSSADAGNQWYLNGVAIAGATGKTYSPTTSGDYTVRVTLANCQSPLSAAFTFNITAINSPELDRQILIGPNPAKGELNIKYTGNAPSLQVTITDLWGRQVYRRNFISSLKVETHGFTSKIYVVEIQNLKTKERTQRLVMKE